MRLARWEKVVGLLGDITVPRADVSDVRVLEDPMRDVLRTGLKAGLRLPWLYYVARTIRLDEAWLVRRGVPALSFAVRNPRSAAARGREHPRSADACATTGRPRRRVRRVTPGGPLLLRAPQRTSA